LSACRALIATLSSWLMVLDRDRRGGRDRSSARPPDALARYGGHEVRLALCTDGYRRLRRLRRVDQPRPAADEYERSGIRKTACLRGRDVDHDTDARIEQLLRRDAVEVGVVDDRDVVGREPPDEPLRAAIEPRGAGELHEGLLRCGSSSRRVSRLTTESQTATGSRRPKRPWLDRLGKVALISKRSALLLLAAVLVAGTSAAARSADSRSRAAPRAVRIGGIDAVPAIRPWRYVGPNPDGWWCHPGACRDVSNGTVFVDKEARLTSQLHVRIVRLDFPWAFIQPRRGAHDWTRADYIVRALRKYKLQIHAVLAYTPAWAGTTEATPPSAADFSAFARAFARRYRPSIRYYELWNEPDLQRYWAGTEEQFVKTILVPGYRAIKKGAPAGRVVVGPSFANRGWLEDLYRFGGGRSFDIMSWHDYSGDARILANAAIVQSVLRAHGQARKPIWLGEYGFEEPGLDDGGHAGLLTQVLTTKAPFAVAEWYALRDDYPMTCCPPQIIDTSTYGVLTADYRPKKSYRVMQSLLRPR
jgi:hypothetical protein